MHVFNPMIVQQIYGNRIRSKNIILIFVREKELVQVYSNCDKFPVSLIFVIRLQYWSWTGSVLNLRRKWLQNGCDSAGTKRGGKPTTFVVVFVLLSLFRSPISPLDAVYAIRFCSVGATVDFSDHESSPESSCSGKSSVEILERIRYVHLQQIHLQQYVRMHG